MNSYIYAFIRQDISPEQRIVQIGHACFEAGKMFRSPDNISSLVLLSARNEQDLKNISAMLDGRDIDHYAFYEPDFGMGYSAICTKPITDSRERAIFRKWNLFRHTD
jgi:hypothetical protein